MFHFVVQPLQDKSVAKQEETQIKAPTERQQESLSSLKDILVDEMMAEEEDDGFAVRIGGVNSFATAKPQPKSKAKATAQAKNQKPLLIASKIRSGTLRAFNACEAAARTAKSSAIECLMEALTDEVEKDSPEVNVLKNRLRVLNLMMDIDMNDGLQDHGDVDGMEEMMCIHGGHGDHKGQAIYELLQLDAYFKESSSCPDPDHIQTLARMRMVRPLAEFKIYIHNT